ncbi:MAG: LysM peptidoglycan-binding domain-containing protein [Bacteroidales bacterium]|nr:LysM peptidoglycan-binding domain-containing protein [Bacteroidales bacterium]
MKKFFVLFLLLTTLSAAAQTVNIPISNDIQTKNGKQFYIHTVQKGQTVYSIAKAYHIAIPDLYNYNASARNGIQIGQKLWIPVENNSATTPQNKPVTTSHQDFKLKSFDFFYHVAAPGETIAHVSSIYLVPEKYILLANPGLKGPLKEGEYIKIPVEDAYKILDAQANQTEQNTQATPVKHYKVPAPPMPQEKKTTFKLPASSQSKPKQTSSSVNTQNQTEVPFIKNYQHVVIPGETMQSIASKYDITVAQLKSVNPGLVMIMQGQRLRLPTNAKVPGYQPTTQQSAPAKKPVISDQSQEGKEKKQVKKTEIQDVHTGKYIKHTVKKGETLYSISRRYGINLSDLFQANKNLTTNISIGQVILIPKKKMNEPYVLYSPYTRIRLKKVARLYKVDPEVLKNKNPRLGNKVNPGEVIRIPVETYVKELSPVSPGKEVISQPQNEEEKTPEVSPLGCSPTPHPDTFKVALMVPLYLHSADSLDKAQFMLQDQKNFAPFTFIRFLQGGLLAAKLMKQQGMNVQLYVFDVDQQTEKAEQLLANPELKEMNLIIGPFYSRSFNLMAAFASQNNIPIVNPFTFREAVLDQDQGVMKIQPGLQYQLPLIKKYISENQKFDKIFLIHQGNEADDSVMEALGDSLKQVLPQNIKFSNLKIANLGVAVTQREKEQERQDFLKLMEADPNHEIYPADTVLPPVTTTISDTLRPFILENRTVYPDSLKFYITDSTRFSNNIFNVSFATDSLHPFTDNASVLRKNLVILYGTNKAFVMDVMNRLNVIRDTFNIRLIGLPQWEDFTEMDYNQMNNLDLVYPASYAVNYQSNETKDLDSLFVHQFGSMPEKYGNMGFDITYYFLNALYYMGNQMSPCVPFYPYKGISTQFKFKQAGNKDNYENTFWNLLQIKDMKLHNITDQHFEKRPSPLLPDGQQQ